MKLPPHGKAACVALALVAATLALALPPRHVTVSVLDIGQGDAILVQDGYVQTLIDGGPDGAVLARLGDAMPFFDRTIEFVVLTHPHADHYGGLVSVFARYDVRTVLVGSRVGDSKDYDAFLRALDASGARIVEVRAGDSLALGRRATAYVLWPPSDPAAHAAMLAQDDDNEKSVVFRMEAADRTALFTGDATPDVEAALVAADPSVLRADFLKVAHHGSRYSSTMSFLEAVRPSVAAISVGVKNGYGHPGWNILARLRSMGVQTFRTDQDGTIRATFMPDGIVVKQTRK